MEHDYYAILGVSQSADAATLRAAYRRRACEVHPDRGGSHAEMTLVNAAWEILSDPAKRRRYDEARVTKSSLAVREAAAAEARTAHETAARYPRRWVDFERWMAAMLDDFTGAQYGHETSAFGMTWPSVQNSVSASVFVTAGGIAGGALVYLVGRSYFASHSSMTVRAIGVGAMVGAWIGLSLHRGLAAAIGRLVAIGNGPSSAPRNPSGATAAATTQCSRCQQRLRVPHRAARLRCPNCRYEFSHAA